MPDISFDIKTTRSYIAYNKIAQFSKNRIKHLLILNERGANKFYYLLILNERGANNRFYYLLEMKISAELRMEESVILVQVVKKNNH